MAQIFLNDRRHRHPKSRRKILHGHGLLPFRIRQQTNQAPGQVHRISRLVKLNRYFLSVGHLTEILKVRAGNRHSVGAG
jgi:hypothetical protein